MVIDLRRCVGCSGCVVTCKVEHCTPPGIFWARLLMKEQGKFPNVSRLIVPVLCNHCKNAPCVKVCPSGATSQGEDGIVSIDVDKCIGCRYCMMACPYGSRFFCARLESYFDAPGLTPSEKLGYAQFQTGVVVKCNFCQERIKDGLSNGLKPGTDREATPACVNSCAGKARYFGDLDDPESEVSRLIRSRQGKPMHPEFGSDPSVYYLQ